MVGGRIGDYLQRNFPFITTPRLVYFLIAILAVALIYAIYEAIFFKKEIKAQTITDSIEPDIDSIEPDLKDFFNLLKKRYKQRYDNKLDGRFEITLEVSEEWNSNKSKTYKFDAEAKISNALYAVRKAFDEKGGLLIVGSPGSGKTVLLLKLACELLGDEYKTKQNLPIIFNLVSWSEEHKTFEDWLIDVLNSGDGLSKDFAKTVLREKRIIFLLDGLDELARNENTETAINKRAECLHSLNNYLCEGRNAVICCRREEFVEMQKTTNQDAPVSAKVEVLDLTKADILLALQEARKHNESRKPVEHFEEIIETNDVFLEVLSTPFYFTTALEVFDKHLLKEKDLPSDTEKLKKYLLDKFVESKLSRPQTLTEYEQDTVKINKWLKWFAGKTKQKGLVNFELSDLQPTDLIKKWHYDLLIGLIEGLIFGLVFGVILGAIGGSFYQELWIGVIFGIVMGLVLGVGVGVIYSSIDNIETEDIISLDYSKLLYPKFWTKILYSLIIGLVLGLLTSKVWGGAISVVLIVILGFKHLKEIRKIKLLQKNYQRIYGGFYLNLFFASFVFLLLTSFFLILNYSNLIKGETELYNLQKILHVFWIVLILPLHFVFNTPLFRHLILRLCFWFEGSMPLKYATFLDYGAKARILEKDGGHWRLRHQNLQDYFANLDI